MSEPFGTIRAVTQLELENFGSAFSSADDADGGEHVPTAVEIHEREMAARLALKEKLSGDDLPSWSDVYHRLLQSGWKWKLAAYAAWASTPKDGRWPKTQEELATQVLGLSSDRVISTWNKKFPTLQQVIFDLSSHELMDARADVFDALKFMAKQRDYKANADRRIYLEMIGAYVPTSKLSAELKRRGITTDDLADMSDEDLRILAGQAKETLNKSESVTAANEGGEDK